MSDRHCEERRTLPPCGIPCGIWHRAHRHRQSVYEFRQSDGAVRAEVGGTLPGLRILPFRLSEKENPPVLPGVRFWCGHRDLNSDGVNHTPLKRTRLPVPPWPHSDNSILLSAPFVNGFGRVLSRFSRSEYDAVMTHAPCGCNALAVALADALCRGRSPEEVAELLRLLNLLCSLIKTYL